MPQTGIRGTMLQLLAQTRSRQPARATPMRNDVGNRLAMHGQCDPLTRLHGVDHLSGPVAEIANTYQHCATV